MSFTSLRNFGLASLALALVACTGEASRSDVDSASAEQVTSNPRNVKSAPVAGEDGRDVYLVGGPLTDISRLDAEVASADPIRIGSLNSESTIRRFERRGHFLFWTGIAGTRYFVGQMEEGHEPKTLFLPTGTVIDDASRQIVATKDGLVAFTAQRGSTTTLTILDAVAAKKTEAGSWPATHPHALLESLDGKSLLDVDRDNNLVRRFASGSAVGSSGVSVPLAIDGREVSHFDGKNVFLTSSGELTNVDLTTGVETRLANTLYGPPRVARDRVVFQTKDGAASPHQFGLHSMGRDGSYPVELASIPAAVQMELSQDGANLTVWNQGQSGPEATISAVAQVPVDGSKPLAVSYKSASSNDRINLVAHEAGALLFVVKYASGTMLLPMNDNTGLPLTATKPMYWVSDDADFGLSGDGSTMYAAEDCKVGGANGVKISRISDTTVSDELIPCQLASGRGKLLSIPKSSNILHYAADGTSFEVLTP